MITLSVTRAKTLSQKTFGLIGKRKPYPFLLRTRYGIHTFGLFFPIDVLILDKNNMVVSMKKKLFPFSFFFYNPIFDTVVELPIGIIDSKKIKLGDRIILHEES